MKKIDDEPIKTEDTLTTEEPIKKDDKKTEGEKTLVEIAHPVDEEEVKKAKPITTSTGGKFTSEKIAEKISEEKPKPKPEPKPLPPPVKKVENRNIPCILRFKKVTAKQAANVAKLFRKLKYTNYTIVHSKGHNEWDILVRFDNLDERDKFEKIINKLL